MPMTLTAKIAERVHRIGHDDITPLARHWAKIAILDTIGVTLAGAVEPAPRLLLQVPGIAAAPGPALIIGTGRRTSALDAALVNGTAAHALDYDDVSGALGGHPSAPLVAALLGLAEELGSSGADLLLAYIIGFEVENRMGLGVHHHHYDKGWHPTATLGVFGAAAAAAHLLRLDIDRTATALAIAASLAAGLKANFGTMTKPLHVGHCARSGLFAARLAQQGFTANPAAFEHKQGFLAVFNGPGTFDIGRMLGGWDQGLMIERSELGLKPYPCCGSTHPSIDLMLALAREHAIAPDNVARIEILPHPRRLPHTDNPAPQSGLAAKFSIQYCVARALADGAIRLEHFEGEAWRDPRVARLLAVTEARPHPDMPQEWGSEIVITLAGGRVLAKRQDEYRRPGPDGLPIGRETLWQKFADCAGRVLPQARIAPLFERLETLDEQSSLAPLTALLEAPEPAAKAAE
jgi:2-methylcitrate dehydratase PrpD